MILNRLRRTSVGVGLWGIRTTGSSGMTGRLATSRGAGAAFLAGGSRAATSRSVSASIWRASSSRAAQAAQVAK